MYVSLTVRSINDSKCAYTDYQRSELFSLLALSAHSMYTKLKQLSLDLSNRPPYHHVRIPSSTPKVDCYHALQPWGL